MRKTFCVDASVAPKWWIPEVHSAEALLLRGSGLTLIAPPLLPVELTSVVVQKCRRGHIRPDQVATLILLIRRMPVKILPVGGILARAAELALNFHPSVYDCLYAALALREGCQVVTADRPFYDALRVPFPSTMLWIEDLPAALG